MRVVFVSPNTSLPRTAIVTTSASYTEFLKGRKKIIVATSPLNCSDVSASSNTNSLMSLTDDPQTVEFTNVVAGAFFEFAFVNYSATDFEIAMPTNVLLYGSVVVLDDDDNTVKGFRANGASYCSFNGTTTGGAAGTKVKILFTSTTTAFITGIVRGSGILATPFS